MLFSNTRGFTLIELMVVISIAGILLAYAVPSFNEFSKNNQLKSKSRDLVTLISFARAEAVRLGRSVNVSSIANTPEGNEWGVEGYRAWIDTNNDNDYNNGEEIRVVESASTAMSIDSVTNVTEFTFFSSGLVSAVSVFQLCDDRTGEQGRVVTVLGGGGISAGNIACL